METIDSFQIFILHIATWNIYAHCIPNRFVLQMFSPKYFPSAKLLTKQRLSD